MYHRWLDQYDERKASQGEAVKFKADFAVGSEIGFPLDKGIESISDFCDFSEIYETDLNFFAEPDDRIEDFETSLGWVKFASPIHTESEQNNVVWAKVTPSGSMKKALVVFHHWNADSRNKRIANFFSRRGITVVEIALPYHLERSRSGSISADYMLSSNLGLTLRSVRQGVIDGRKLIRWLRSEGYGDISVLGMSLGSWVAGLVAAHDQSVTNASLFLTAGSLADMVWTGRATRLIRESLTPSIDLADLRRAWGPLNLENVADKLARDSLSLNIVLANRDTVVLPELSQKFVERLKLAGAKPDVVELNCGHYSLAIPPHIIFAGLSLSRLLK